MIDVLLYAPEYRPNLSNMIRSVEFFGLKRIYIYDQNNLLEPPHNKATRADMNHLARVWTAGAIEHIEVIKVDDPEQFIQSREGRAIATMIDESAIALQDFIPQENDLIIMGPEKEGLPVSFASNCDQQVYLNARGHTDCLNVSVMLGVIMYHAISFKIN